jgi:hypothetical protein
MAWSPIDGLRAVARRSALRVLAMTSADSHSSELDRSELDRSDLHSSELDSSEPSSAGASPGVWPGLGTGGPPADWVERVRRGARHLLEPAPPSRAASRPKTPKIGTFDPIVLSDVPIVGDDLSTVGTFAPIDGSNVPTVEGNAGVRRDVPQLRPVESVRPDQSTVGTFSPIGGANVPTVERNPGVGADAPGLRPIAPDPQEAPTRLLGQGGQLGAVAPKDRVAPDPSKIGTFSPIVASDVPIFAGLAPHSSTIGTFNPIDRSDVPIVGEKRVQQTASSSLPSLPSLPSPLPLPSPQSLPPSPSSASPQLLLDRSTIGTFSAVDRLNVPIVADSWPQLASPSTSPHSTSALHESSPAQSIADDPWPTLPDFAEQPEPVDIAGALDAAERAIGSRKDFLRHEQEQWV